jgi:hypothetical protein
MEKDVKDAVNSLYKDLNPHAEIYNAWRQQEWEGG